MTRPLLNPLLIALLGIALAAFLLQPILSLPPAARLHLVFAVGILPLILGSISWFTPVLTRSGAAERSTLGPPLLALAAGLLLLYALSHEFRLFPAAALIALTAVAWLSWWIRSRVATAFGRPHPGLLWYRLALGALALGLIAILLGAFWPAQWLPLRRLHLHLNLFGFIGLTALGTWRVLLPTVAGFSDPEAGPWLQRRWRPLALGTLLMALGAAWWPPLSIAGLLLWLAPLGGLLKQPVYARRDLLLRRDGAAPSLAAALIGLVLILLAGAGHALQLLPAAPAATAFVLLFLMPLVTGAASHLLPLWRFPEAADRRQAMGRRLGRFGGLRGLLFLIAGLSTLAGVEWGWLPAAAGLGQFMLAVGLAYRAVRVTTASG